VDDQRFRQVIESAVERDGRPYYRNDTAMPVQLHVGRRIEVEFWCGECRHYIYVKLNTALAGNHVMVCPNCGHKHYRLVKNGVITSDRFTEGMQLADEIIPMKSAAVPQDERRQRGNVAILREMEACGLLK